MSSQPAFTNNFTAMDYFCHFILFYFSYCLSIFSYMMTSFLHLIFSHLVPKIFLDIFPQRYLLLLGYFIHSISLHLTIIITNYCHGSQTSKLHHNENFTINIKTIVNGIYKYILHIHITTLSGKPLMVGNGQCWCRQVC